MNTNIDKSNEFENRNFGNQINSSFFNGIKDAPTKNLIAITRAILSFTFESLQPGGQDKDTLICLQNQFEFLADVYAFLEKQREEESAKNNSD